MKYVPHAVDMKSGINHRVYIRMDEADEKTQGGLALPEIAQMAKNTGTVLASTSPALHEGDRVIVDGLGGRDMMDERGAFKCYDECEVLGVARGGD